MSKSKQAKLERLAAAVKKLSPVKGWHFAYEYPGFFAFHKWHTGTRGVMVACTPAYHQKGEIAVEATDEEGNIVFCRDVPFSGKLGKLTANRFVKIMRPILSQIDKSV